jgi:RNA polymerase sigma factor (sigma-70 family)
MGRGQLGPVVQQFQHLFAGRSIAGVSEWQLLHRYLDRRDEVAFEAIVSRHGPMVLGVCRRILSDSRDVEDAFQATFLILARKGGTLGEGDPVGHWLYGVAYRVALRARASAARRRSLERSATLPEVARVDDSSRLELGSVIDEELARLPSKYRAPIVLCYLEGLTHDEAGRELGWPVGTVKGRLSRARDLLKGRLSRRGVAPAGVATMVALVRESRAAVPSLLREFTMRAAMAGPSAGVVPASVSELVTGSLTTMFLSKLKAAGAVALVLGSGAAVMAYQYGGSSGQGGAKAQGRLAVAVAEKDAKLSNSTVEVADWEAGWPSLINRTDESPGTKAILGALEDRMAMQFPNDTPLEDVLKYIQQSTKRTGLPNGIPIYVDPQALQIAEKTMTSTVSLNLEEVPLKTTLELALKQLTLTYRIKDGLMIIESSSEDSENTPLNILQAKAMRGELTRVQYQQLIEMLKLRNQVTELMNPAMGVGIQ